MSNLRWQKYKANRMAGMSKYKSAIAAGYSHSTAWCAYKNIEKRWGFDKVMAENGLDDESLLRVIERGINVVDDAGQPAMVSKGFVEIALKLNGKWKDKVEHSGIPGTVVNVYPSKTVIFKDINDSDSERNRDLHVAESSARSLPEGTVQSP